MSQIQVTLSALPERTFTFICLLKGEIEYRLGTSSLLSVIHHLEQGKVINRHTTTRELQIILSQKRSIAQKMGWNLFHLEHALEGVSFLCLPSSPSRIFTLETRCGKLVRFLVSEATCSVEVEIDF